MTMKTLLSLFLVSVLLLLASCAPTQARPPIATDSGSSTQKTTIPISNDQAPSPEVLEKTAVVIPDKSKTPDANAQKLVLLAIEDLSKVIKISAEEIQVSAVQPVVWPDTSLGCPQPGVAYAQVITRGYILVLEAANTDYRYHTDDSATVFLCQEGELPEFIVTPGEIQDGKPWMPVP
jgi:hypothetical protein